MAIQDFIGGGYTGKLGATIGQRYYGRYYTRTYTAPRDPGTPAQAAHRARFAAAVHLAQQALNVNKGAAYWQRPDMSEYAWRVSTASRRLKAGMSPEDALPIYPDAYTPDIILPVPAITWSQDPADHVILIWPAITGLAGRALALELYTWIRYTGAWARISRQIAIPATGIISLLWPWTGAQSYPAGAWIEGVSTDDAQPAKPSIKLPRQSILQPHPPAMTIKPPITIIEWSVARRVAVVGSFIPLADAAGPYTWSAYSINPATGAETTYNRTIQITGGVVPPVEIPWDRTHQYPGDTTLYLGEQSFGGQYLDTSEQEEDIWQPYTPTW